MIEKLDDIFIYFVEHRTKPTWSERRKFNILERLAYDAYKEEVKRRFEKILYIRKQNKLTTSLTEANLKYSEEKRILERAW